MSVRVWNTSNRRKEELEPLEPPRLRLFVSGPTVYDDSHRCARLRDRVFGFLGVAHETSEHDAWVTAELERRDRLRRERSFAEADEIRERLRDLQVIVEDTEGSSLWYRRVGSEHRPLVPRRRDGRT